MESDQKRARHYPPKPAHVYLFATCLIDQFAPEAGLDTVRLLEREGIAVHFPEDQTCCGQPAYSSGYPDEARAVARRQLGLFPGVDYTEDVDALIKIGRQVLSPTERGAWTRSRTPLIPAAKRLRDLLRKRSK